MGNDRALGRKECQRQDENAPCDKRLVEVDFGGVRGWSFCGESDVLFVLQIRGVV